MNLTESHVEDATLEWFGELGYALTPALSQDERKSFGDVVLVGRLRAAIRRLNPVIPKEAREEALRKVLRVATPSLIQTNRAFHRMLRDGVDVECPRHGVACDILRVQLGQVDDGTPPQRLALVPAGQQRILEQDNGKKRWIQVVKELSRAFALCAASEEATKTREGIGLRDKTRRRSWPDG